MTPRAAVSASHPRPSRRTTTWQPARSAPPIGSVVSVITDQPSVGVILRQFTVQHVEQRRHHLMLDAVDPGPFRRVVHHPLKLSFASVLVLLLDHRRRCHYGSTLGLGTFWKARGGQRHARIAEAHD